MSETVTLSTGNAIVDAIGQIHIEGNVIPHAWYQTIKYPNGKANILAINILSDILYWYRPTIIRTENLTSITVKKKFKEDLLQRSYDQLADFFGITKRQATDNVIFLEKLGAIKRHFRTVVGANGVKSNNVLFIELIPSGIYALTYPNVDVAQFRDTSHVKTGEPPTLKRETLPRYNGTGPTLKRETNTEITTKITTKTSTKNIYSDFVLLTEEEYEKLVNKFGQQDADEKIETLAEYLGSTGKKYQSDYHTILSWARRDAKDNRGKQNAKNERAERLARENNLPF